MVLAGLAVLTLLSAVLAIGVGSVSIPPSATMRYLTTGDAGDPTWTVLLEQVRLPRAITAILAGAGLAVAGLLMQTLFANPLADPYILGVSSGAGLGVAGICAKPTPEIQKLQMDIIAAASPFNLRSGPIGAFTASHDNADLDAGIIGYVSKFEQVAAGAKFNPHVSTGNAPTTYLDQMVAEPFEPFTFSPAGAAVYQLGPFGTAAKQLKEWDLKR